MGWLHMWTILQLMLPVLKLWYYLCDALRWLFRHPAIFHHLAQNLWWLSMDTWEAMSDWVAWRSYTDFIITWCMMPQWCGRRVLSGSFVFVLSGTQSASSAPSYTLATSPVHGAVDDTSSSQQLVDISTLTPNSQNEAITNVITLSTSNSFLFLPRHHRRDIINTR